MVAFLEACIESDQTYAVFNYVDTPNMTMNELISIVRKKLNKSNNARLRIPYWLGLPVAYMSDIIANVTGKNLPISSIRLKKFVSSTEFLSAKTDLKGFEPPFSLKAGLHRTLHSEFISPEPNQEIFFTE